MHVANDNGRYMLCVLVFGQLGGAIIVTDHQGSGCVVPVKIPRVLIVVYPGVILINLLASHAVCFSQEQLFLLNWLIHAHDVAREFLHVTLHRLPLQCLVIKFAQVKQA